MANIEIRDERPRECRPFQFSIRSMLILTAVVAAGCSYVFALPDPAAQWVGWAVLLLVAGPLACLAVFGSRRQRAFGIGALASWFLVAWVQLWIVMFLDSASLDRRERIAHVFAWLLCFASGFLSCLTQRWIERDGANAQPPSRPESSSCNLSASSPPWRDG